MNIDMVPTANDDTKWRPALPGLIYARWDLQSWEPPARQSSTPLYIGKTPGELWFCPSPARPSR